MRRLLAAGWLLLGLGACRQTSTTEQPQPEYADWYALRAPEARDIEAVIGDLDGVLIITTRYNIYRTTDRGKTWQTSQPSNLGIVGFVEHRDTLFTLTGGLGSVVDSTAAYATHPTHYSADRGLTWQRYQYSRSTAAFADARVPRNRVRTPSGATYRIKVDREPSALGTNLFYVFSRGLEGPVGALPALPGEHQINSIYLDKQARLYVAASAAKCGQGTSYGFCGEQNGVLFVSKKPLP